MIAACAVLHPDGSYPNKARAGFHAYDFDGDGVVNEKDLTNALRLILGDGVSERQVTHLVDQLKKKFDENGDGVLQEKEFARCSRRMTSRRGSPWTCTARLRRF